MLEAATVKVKIQVMSGPPRWRSFRSPPTVFHPPETLLHQLAFLLTDRVAGVPRRAAVIAVPRWAVLTAAMEARVLAKTQQPPPDGSTHRRTRKLGRVLKIHHNLIAETLAANAAGRVRRRSRLRGLPNYYERAA